MCTMMKREVAVAAMLGCSLGCGAAEDRAPDDLEDGSVPANSLQDNSPNESSPAIIERRICDGSADIRLAIGYGGGGPPAPYTSVLSELGYDFLYVDGGCRYWAHKPLSASDEYYLWRPYREGVLTPADEQRLHDAVNYDGVPADTCAPRMAVFDAGAGFFWDGQEFRSCADDAFDDSGPLRAELYDKATAVAGPMRIQVGKDSYPNARVVYEWPLDPPIDQFVTEYGELRSFRIDGHAAATALRTLRERAIADAEVSSGYFLGVIPIRLTEGDQTYFMSLRDELPFVGTDGSWAQAP
jgi:hypothetical protein